MRRPGREGGPPPCRAIQAAQEVATMGSGAEGDGVPQTRSIPKERPTTAHEFLERLRAGTADSGAMIALWHLVYTLRGRAKIDIAEPKPGWSLQVRPSGDAR